MGCWGVEEGSSRCWCTGGGMTLPPDTAALVERLQSRLARADEAEAGRKALIVRFDTDYSPEADEAIRGANNEQMAAKAMLAADAVHSLPSLLATIEAQARRIEGLREALTNVSYEAEREHGGLVHLKRAVAVAARANRARDEGL